jgi:hypothetical protein
MIFYRQQFLDIQIFRMNDDKLHAWSVIFIAAFVHHQMTCIGAFVLGGAQRYAVHGR